MAEAFPEEPQYLDEKIISVLLLASRWQFDTYGLSTINKSIIGNLRLVNPDGKTIKTTCAVVEEEGKIKAADLEDAEKYKVELKGAKRPRSKKKHNKPELQWLDEDAAKYYRHLVQDQHYDFIIGHAPYLANGCFNLKDFYTTNEASPKTILMFHALPRDENGDVDDEMMTEWLKEADVVFSVGKAVESELVPYVAAIDEHNRPIHKMYIPSYPLELFHIVREDKQKKIEGTQNITMMSAEYKDLDVTGLDFPLAVNATIGAAEHIRDFDGVRTNLTMLAAHEDDKEKWKAESNKECRRQNILNTGLHFKTEVPTDVTKLQSYLIRSTLFLLPLKPDSPLFGTEALSAIAAGVPVLVSKYSGIARLLQNMTEDEPVVYETKSQSAINIWKDRILERLLRPDESQRSANRLREQLLLDTSIAQTHLDFINIIAKKSSVDLRIEIQSDSFCGIPRENLDAAIKFGMKKTDGSDINKYILAFLKKLLFQSQKLEKELLRNFLQPAVDKQWKEVISSMEERNRKLINLQSGSLILTLFCPTKRSWIQLRDENWRIEIQRKITELIKLLAGVGVSLKLQTDDSVDTEHFTQRTEKVKTADSEKRSAGYGTMTTASDVESEVLESELKVEDWLSHQSGVVKLEGRDQSLQLVETWTLDHVQGEHGTVYTGNSFTVSESGAVGISCHESPSLSVMYPNTNKAPVVLSDRKVYRSATFVNVSGKEYLSVSSDEDGCLYLWDIESKTAKKVFAPKLSRQQRSNYMNICKISEGTIGYGGIWSDIDRSRNVFILSTDTAEEWILCGTLKFLTPSNIWHICCTKLADGTSCLLLCLPHVHRIMAVEMVGCKTRWEVGPQLMGDKFFPCSICTDEDNSVYVTDYLQQMMHVLSAEDGSVITSVDLRQYGILNPVAIKTDDHYLYVEHYRAPGCKYVINKFQRNI